MKNNHHATQYISVFLFIFLLTRTSTISAVEVTGKVLAISPDGDWITIERTAGGAAKPATLDIKTGTALVNIEVGKIAVMNFDPEFEVVTSLTAANLPQKPLLLEVAELNAKGSRDPWLTKDGLRIYYYKHQSGIWTAERSSTNEPFRNETFVMEGRHPTVSGDGLHMVMIRRANIEKPGECLWQSHRSSTNRPFKPAVRIQELERKVERPKSPWISPSGLELMFNCSSGQGNSVVVVCRRETLTGVWSSPVPLRLPAVDGRITWTNLLNSGKVLLACVENPPNQLGKIVCFKREGMGAPFSKPIDISLEAGEPIARSPRFVPETHELFLAISTHNMRRPKELNWGIFRLVNFELPAFK